MGVCVCVCADTFRGAPAFHLDKALWACVRTPFEVYSHFISTKHYGYLRGRLLGCSRVCPDEALWVCEHLWGVSVFYINEVLEHVVARGSTWKLRAARGST